MASSLRSEPLLPVPRSPSAPHHYLDLLLGLVISGMLPAPLWPPP